MKGYVYTLEIVLGLMLMLVTFVSLFSNPPSKPEIEISIMKQTAFNAMDFLNKQGLLREFVLNNSESEVESRLSGLLTKSVNVETEICTESCSSAGVPSKGSVIALDYYVSSFNGNYMGKRVRLWVWRK